MRKNILIFVLLVIAAAIAFVFVRGKRLLLDTALAQQVSYFRTTTTTGARLDRLTSRVYTFQWYFDRTLIIDTDEGLVIVDPFNEHLTGALRAALARAGVNKPVHTLIYTHHHLDHVRGGAVLKPAHVVAHAKCPGYWHEQPRELTDGVLPATRLIDGDTDLHIGGVTIRLLYLGRSHTDTLYAVHVPEEKLLYAADFVAVKTFLPGGGIALYGPGYMRALDRLASIPFETFVSSHFGWGTKRDFLDAVQLQKDLRRLVRESMQRHAGPVPQFMTTEGARTLIDEVLPPIRERYGTWHGFNSQAVSSIFAVYTSEFVGE